MARGGLKGVVLTGSVFEQDEGAGEAPLVAFSPYGLSKGLTAADRQPPLPRIRPALRKFVIPNPFGPLEEPRFCAYLVRVLEEGRERAGEHAELCARQHPRLACSRRLTPNSLARRTAGQGRRKLNPSGYVEAQGAFAERFAAAMRPRLGLACGLELAIQTDFSEPLMRVNADSAARYVGELG